MPVALIDLLVWLLLAAGVYVGLGLHRFGDIALAEYKRASTPEERFEAAASAVGCILLWPWSVWLQLRDGGHQ